MTTYAERRDAAYERTLTAIDDATERRCSYCHKPLPTGSVSEWFCNPDPSDIDATDCQWSWNQQHADDPGGVYDRTDAGHQIELEQLQASYAGRVGRGHRGSWVDFTPFEVTADLAPYVQAVEDEAHRTWGVRGGRVWLNETVEGR